jgi:Transposase DDE domain
MATSGRGSGVVGYNVQVAVDTQHHLIITHEVTNTGSDRSQLANIASQAKDVLGADHLDVVADRGYFSSTEILACEEADITVTLPKPMTSNAKTEGRLGKQDFRYVVEKDLPLEKRLLTPSRPKNAAWFCAVTGPTLASAAPSNIAALRPRSD